MKVKVIHMKNIRPDSGDLISTAENVMSTVYDSAYRGTLPKDNIDIEKILDLFITSHYSGDYVREIDKIIEENKDCEFGLLFSDENNAYGEIYQLFEDEKFYTKHHG